MNDTPDSTLEQSDSFRFEAIGAPIPIMAAQWPDNNPDKASLIFHNEKFLELYNDHRGKLLIDFLNELTLNNKGKLHLSGKCLLDDILEHGKIHSIQGSLAGRRVELFAKLQKNTKNCIQSTIFDVTDRLLDHVTGLPGRELLFDRININLYKAIRNKENFSLLFLDLDSFKKANDVFGHHIGDAILAEVGERLSSVIRRHETVARIGGDEFVICLTNTTAEAGQKFSDEKLIPLLNQPYLINETKIDFIGVSVGVASFPRHSVDINALMEMADSAMYDAKKAGKNQTFIY